MTVHFISWSSHRDIQAACGVSAFGWELEDDPEGTVGGDSNDTRIYFAKDGEEARVDCPGCLPKAQERIERRARYEAEVEAAGGYVAWKAQVDARVAAIIARRKQERS